MNQTDMVPELGKQISKHHPLETYLFNLLGRQPQFATKFSCSTAAPSTLESEHLRVRDCPTHLVSPVPGAETGL